MKIATMAVLVLAGMSTLSSGQQHVSDIKAELTRESLGSEAAYLDYVALTTNPVFKSHFPDLWYGLIRGWRPPSRYDAALAVHMTISFDQQAIESAKAQEARADLPDFKEIRACVPAQIALVRQFSKELRTLGVDPDTEVKQLYQVLDDAKQLQAKDDGGIMNPHIDLTPGANEIANDIDTLQRAGILVGRPFGLDRRGNWGTPYEIAIAAHATYTHMRNRLRNASTASQPNMVGLAASSSAPLVQLMTQFSDEMVTLGVDNLPEIRREVEGWRQLGSPTIPPTRVIDKTSETDWIFKEVEQLRRDGSIRGYPDGMHAAKLREHPTNIMLASMTIETSEHLEQLLKGFRAEKVDIYFDGAIYSAESAVHAAALKRLADFLGPELKSMGQDPASVQRLAKGWHERVEQIWRAQNMGAWAKINEN
jgi:hypothetical protein